MLRKKNAELATYTHKLRLLEDKNVELESLLATDKDRDIKLKDILLQYHKCKEELEKSKSEVGDRDMELSRKQGIISNLENKVIDAELRIAKEKDALVNRYAMDY